MALARAALTFVTVFNLNQRKNGKIAYHYPVEVLRVIQARSNSEGKNNEKIFWYRRRTRKSGRLPNDSRFRFTFRLCDGTRISRRRHTCLNRKRYPNFKLYVRV